MPIPSPVSLDAFERAIQADPAVLGVFYFGSLGRGAAGRFSDLDIFVWLAEDLAIPTRDKLLQLLDLLGENHWLETSESDVTGFVGPEWTQADIELGRRENLVPSPRYAGSMVIKDTDGVLATMVAACEPEQITETVESAGDIIHGAISDLLFLARHNARGAIWSARGNITYQSTRVYELLGRLRGRHTYGYRYGGHGYNTSSARPSAHSANRSASRSTSRGSSPLSTGCTSERTCVMLRRPKPTVLFCRIDERRMTKDEGWHGRRSSSVFRRSSRQD